VSVITTLAEDEDFIYRQRELKNNHMRWKTSAFLSGVNLFFRYNPGAKGKPIAKSIHDIREAMLKAMGSDASSKFPVIQLRVTYADDVHDLWYLRGDVMAAIASFDGEVLAREKVASISEMFVGLVPKSLTSSTNVLSRRLTAS